jgi:hypothetical protein
MLDYVLPDDERAELDVGIGMPREVLLGGELLRRWRIVFEGGGETWLRHAQGAMLRVAWSEGAISAFDLHEGEAGRAADRAWSWRFERSGRERLLALRVGDAWEPALIQAFGPRHLALRNLDVCFDGAGQRRRYRAGGVVDVALEPDGALKAIRLLEGAEAADLAEAVVEAPFSARDGVPGVKAARTWGEALLFVRSLAGRASVARVDSAWDPVRVVICADTPEGARRFTFTLADPVPLDPTELGAGASTLLDGVDFVLAASSAEKAGELALAASAVEQAARLVPPGALSLDATGLKSRTAAHALASQPARFTRAALEAEAARLRAASR